MSTANSILPALLRIEDRAAIFPKQAGNGLAWKNKMAARCRLV
jgi:hypothetical protein